MADHPAPLTARLASALGGARALGVRIETVAQLRTRTRAGLPFASLQSLGEAYAIDRKRLAAILAIPERTLARRKREKRLRTDESDRLLRVARIAALAETTLGGREAAVRWLHRPNRALGNAVPLAYLDTELGAREVEDLLGRIAHGIPS
jgi:putative toxin-antitoxin system antitoxin component (TIGR02293 family)